MTQKWNLQDIRPNNRQPKRPLARGEMVINNRSNRRASDASTDDLPLPDKEEFLSAESNVLADDDITDTITIKDRKKTNRSSLMVVVVVIVLLVGGILGVSLTLSKTVLVVTPVSKEPTVNAEFLAYPDKRESSLTYEILTIDTTGERQVDASGQVEVEEPASGFIEIKKTTAGSERLIANTRFKSPEGLIFRIAEAVVIPGALKDEQGNLVAGSIRAKVVSDGKGQDYNLPAGTRFSVPGFQESGLTELFNSIYAENPEAFIGGFKGPRFNIDEDLLSVARQSLQAELRNQLLKDVEGAKPAGMVYFPGAVSITYNELPPRNFGENIALISEQAVLQVPIFKQTDFAVFIARETIPSFDRGVVEIRNPEDLEFSYTASETNSADLSTLEFISFSLSGKPLIVWDYDVQKLQADLAGKSLSGLQSVAKDYPGIEKARVDSKPFWKRSFPSSAESITIVEELNK